MKMLQSVFMLVVLVILSSCTKIVRLSPVYIPDTSKMFEKTTQKDKELLSRVGDILYLNEKKILTDAVRYKNKYPVRFPAPVFDSWSGLGFDRKEIVELEPDSLLGYGYLYEVSELPRETWVFYTKVSWLRRQFPDTATALSENAYFVVKSDSLIKLAYAFQGKDEVYVAALKKPVPVERVVVPIETDGGFKWELLYMGIQNNSIVLTYREFSKDMIRPGFTQAVYYNLAEIKDNVIWYKDVKIQIIEYNNQFIKYKIL